MLRGCQPRCTSLYTIARISSQLAAPVVAFTAVAATTILAFTAATVAVAATILAPVVAFAAAAATTILALIGIIVA